MPFQSSDGALSFMDYQANNRGKIQYRERSRQIIDFSGLQYGFITPTDIDGLIEYKGIAYALIEMKYGNAEMPDGQKLAIERMINDFQKNGKLSAAFLCQHNVQNPEIDILAANSIVRSCYFNKIWRLDGKKTLKQRLDAFIQFAESMHSKRKEQ